MRLLKSLQFVFAIIHRLKGKIMAKKMKVEVAGLSTSVRCATNPEMAVAELKSRPWDYLTLQMMVLYGTKETKPGQLPYASINLAEDGTASVTSKAGEIQKCNSHQCAFAYVLAKYW